MKAYEALNLGSTYRFTLNKVENGYRLDDSEDGKKNLNSEKTLLKEFVKELIEDDVKRQALLDKVDEVFA